MKVGDIIDQRYVVLRVVHADGQGARLVCTDKATRATVTVERWRVPPGSPVRAQARSLMTAIHPGFPAVLDFNEAGSELMLVMSEQSGQPLSQAITRPPPDDDLVRMATTLIDWLTCLQRLDPPVVTADVGPDNVLLQEDGSLALASFGLRPDYGPPGGTPRDIRLLGGTLYFLMTAVLPPASPAALRPLRELRPDASEKTVLAVERMMALRNADRPINLEQVRVLLGLHTTGQPAPAAAPPAPALHPWIPGQPRKAPLPPPQEEKLRPQPPAPAKPWMPSMRKTEETAAAPPEAAPGPPPPNPPAPKRRTGALSAPPTDPNPPQESGAIRPWVPRRRTGKTGMLNPSEEPPTQPMLPAGPDAKPWMPRPAELPPGAAPAPVPGTALDKVHELKPAAPGPSQASTRKTSLPDATPVGPLQTRKPSVPGMTPPPSPPPTMQTRTGGLLPPMPPVAAPHDEGAKAPEETPLLKPVWAARTEMTLPPPPPELEALLGGEKPPPPAPASQPPVSSAPPVAMPRPPMSGPPSLDAPLPPVSPPPGPPRAQTRRTAAPQPSDEETPLLKPVWAARTEMTLPPPPPELEALLGGDTAPAAAAPPPPAAVVPPPTPPPLSPPPAATVTPPAAPPASPWSQPTGKVSPPAASPLSQPTGKVPMPMVPPPLGWPHPAKVPVPLEPPPAPPGPEVDTAIVTDSPAPVDAGVVTPVWATAPVVEKPAPPVMAKILEPTLTEEEAWTALRRQLPADRVQRLAGLLERVDRPLAAWLEQRPELLLPDMESTDRERRVAAALALLNHGLSACKPLLDYVADSDHAAGRGVALYLLSNLVDDLGALLTGRVVESTDDVQVVRLLRAMGEARLPWQPALERILSSSLPAVRGAGVRFLRMADSRPEEKATVVGRVLQSEDPAVLLDALRAATDVGHPQLVQDVAEVLGRAWDGVAEGALVQAQACYTLAHLGQPDVVFPILQAAAQQGPVRAAAAWAIGRLQTSPARDFLGFLLARETDPSVQSAIRLALDTAVAQPTGVADAVRVAGEVP